MTADHNCSRRAFLTGTLNGPPTDGEAHIASLIVYARPALLGQVERALGELAGVEVAAVDASGKLVVTLETADDARLLTLIDRINDTAGVLNANLVYHHSESEAALAEDIDHDHHTP